MGWLPIGGVREILQIVPQPALVWMLVGGLLYTAGTLFLANDQKIRHFHAVWHLMVVAASACHFWAIYAYVAAV
jgi:hemolysin III